MHSPLRNLRRRQFRRTTRGFTLVELLVVISVIVLLIALMLPTLGRARSAAHQTICMHNLRQIGMGHAVYQVNEREYIPGPNTSGYNWNATFANQRSSYPIMPDDWYSPIFGSSLALPASRNERLLAITNSKFHCAANRFRYDYIYPNGVGWPAANTIFQVSYSAPFTMLYYFDSAHAASMGQPAGRYFGNIFDQPVDVRPAKNRFRVTSIGSPSMKVAAMDGSRYLDGNSQISLNVDSGSLFGSNFSCRGPGLNQFYQDNGEPYKFLVDNVNEVRLHPLAKRYAYRHLNDTINTAFFDGHAENLTSAASRKVELWYPKGSIVLNRAGSQDTRADRTVSAGYVVR
jgi:prepilin-type N-terminal cleavage/methylation domain-containing protein/prepilin-type processing-associated H-X9-DG protein